ncbi:pur operon repressor [Allofustis seminis]|uniref:pur operon repressor n=1 Tax=Allofustis seminis TaxID=166939 RepID=UPI00047825DF|nr:pur operon repressor [Allofustis seminis]
MKVKRSERLVEMTIEFIQHPHKIFPLDYFTDRFNAAKSSISEDLNIVKGTFARRHLGEIITYSGARGGVQFIPVISKSQVADYVRQLQDALHQSERLLPGGYIYTSDILSQPEWLKKIGKLIASRYSRNDIDAILTIATKGIPIAQSVAEELGVPFVIVRKASKVTEGSTVGINYVPYSSADVMERMELSTRSLHPQTSVLIIDDFLRGGGTVNGLTMVANEFQCHVVDTVVFIENMRLDEPIKVLYHSLFRIESVNSETKKIQVKSGNFFAEDLSF